MFRKLFFLTCFLSLLIPRSGTKIGEIPLAIPSLLFGLLIGLWFLFDFLLKQRLPRTAITGSLCIYLGWGIMAAIMGLTSARLFNVVNFTVAFVMFPVVFFLTANYIKTPDQLRRFFHMILATLLIVSLYGYAQFLLGFQKVTIPGITMCYSDFFIPDILNLKQNVAPAPARQKMFSTFHNGNLFGHHLVTFLPVIIVMFFETKNKFVKLLSLIAGVVATGALVCSLSRGAAIGFLMSLLFLFLISRRKNLKIFCIAIILVAVLTAVVFDLKYRYVDQIKAEPTGTRWDQWQRAVSRVNELEGSSLIKLLLVGAGLGGQAQGVEYLYSTYFTMWLHMGIIGLLLFIWIILKFFWAGLMSVTLTKDPVILSFLVGGIAGILGALAHMAADALFLLPPVAQNFWMLVGLVMVAIKLAPTTQNENR